MIPNLTTFETRDALMSAAAERMADALRAGIAARGSACAALSGGSTPAPAYARLAMMALDWSKVTLVPVDERFVPPNDEASNEALMRRTMADALASGGAVLPLFAALQTAAEAADAAELRYRDLTIDVALMGMGEDGHTASWFPGVPALGDALNLDNPRTVMALNAPQAAGSPDRLTLTRSAIARAGSVILLITGEEKRARLEHACAHNDAPVSALFAPNMPAPDVLWSA